MDGKFFSNFLFLFFPLSPSIHHWLLPRVPFFRFLSLISFFLLHLLFFFILLSLLSWFIKLKERENSISISNPKHRSSFHTLSHTHQHPLKINCKLTTKTPKCSYPKVKLQGLKYENSITKILLNSNLRDQKYIFFKIVNSVIN